MTASTESSGSGAVVDPKAELRQRWALTVVFVGLVLLSAGIKWGKGWPVGALIVLGIGVFYWIIPTHRWPAHQLLLSFGLCVTGIVLSGSGLVNSPTADLGMTLIVLSVAGRAFSPSLLRPRKFEVLGRSSVHPEDQRPEPST
ncbi:hypothetical protein EON79_21275 [bacterium]|nr:MAG: hypothetical protein EON79_21275 [bacterium]